MNSAFWGLYERLRPHQIDEIIEKKPIAYLPWGAMEYHGNHNPIGLDSIKAFNLCLDLAKSVGGIVLPPVNLAANLIKSFPGVHFPKYSIEFSEKVVRLICEEYLEQLAEQDFKIIVLLSGHAGEPHLEILKDVTKQFNQNYPNKCFWTLGEFEVLPDDLLVANHSALGETSLQLHYAPDTVALQTLPQDREINLSVDAVSGEDPRLSTKEHGEKIARLFVNNASKEIEKLINKFI